jgi:hypothetical protein
MFNMTTTSVANTNQISQPIANPTSCIEPFDECQYVAGTEATAATNTAHVSSFSVRSLTNSR